MRIRMLSAGIGVAATLAAGLVGPTALSSASAATSTPTTSDVRVGSFNITGVNRRPGFRRAPGVAPAPAGGRRPDPQGQARRGRSPGGQPEHDLQGEPRLRRQPVHGPQGRPGRPGRALRADQRGRLQLREARQHLQVRVPGPRRLRRQPDPLQHRHDAAGQAGVGALPDPDRRQEPPLLRVGRLRGEGDRQAVLLLHHAPRPLPDLLPQGAVERADLADQPAQGLAAR